MYYKLEKIYTKNNEQDWSVIIIDYDRALNPTYDERDNDNKKIMEQQERLDKSSPFRETRMSLGDDYVGFDREYVGENDLVVTFYTRTKESARTLYINSPKKHELYEVKWRLINPAGIEVFNKP